MKKIEINSLDLNLFYEKLDNGLEIYIIPKNNFNSIYATFSTKFGSNTIEFQPLNSKKMIKVPLGIAHFLEHKLFEQKDGTDPFSFYSERGADANANTNQKKTTYLFSGTNFFEENLEFLIDYVQEPFFTKENVIKEQGIIEQEIKMYQDDPNTILYEKLLENVFINHPMKHSIIGTIESIKSITKENLYDCYNTFYHPSNMFLVVTGNINPEIVINIVKENQKKKTFDKSFVLKTKKYDEPDKVCKQDEIIKSNVSIPKCATCYKLKINDDLYKELMYLSILFDSKFGPTSDFVENLINEEIINSDLYIDFDHTENHILMIISGESKNPELLLNKIKEEIKNLKITEEEFTRKKKTILSSLIYVSDNIFSLNHSVMNDIIRYNKYNNNRYNIIKDLNYKEFNKIIKNLDFNNFSNITIIPKN